ncbi:hypothetical protein, partial [Rhodospirillum sp. A1_3_36]|uniref:hypothetical protein n=1 Tax=Rhodospirillum sp. A1_3_36 TaxID=3391666 RepID=UPI0039A49C3A
MLKRVIGAVILAGSAVIGISPAGADPITEDTAIFAYIDKIEGDRMILRLPASVMSRDREMETILFVGDRFLAERLAPTSSDDRMRWCVTAILPQQDQGVPHIVGMTDPPCYAMLGDHHGFLELDAPVLDQVVRVMLVGDLVFIEGDPDEKESRGKLQVQDSSGAITEDATLFAVIDAVDGDWLTLHMLH